MPGEGILTIGATVDKTGVDAGLGSIKEGVAATVQTIAVEVEETTSRTKAAWNKLSEDVKVAAQTVSAESLKVAEATKAQTAALADLRRASVLSKDAKLNEAESTAILAAAQVKATAAAAAIAAAKKAEADAVARSAEEEVLSTNAIVAAFQRAAIGARESLSEIQEKLISTAETSKLSAEGIASGFAGLGSLLGAGLVVGFAAHFLDETAKMEIELSHLHEKTGIAVQDLAGLQQLVKESGGEWDAIATGLIKMDKALADSKEPSKEFTAALGGVNLTVAELKGLKPEEQLEKISIALASSENAGNRAAAAIALFGKGGAALIPILVSQGAALHANVEAAGKMVNVSESSIDAAVKWQQTTARLSTEFRSVMIPTIVIVEKAIAALLAVVKAVDAAIWTVIDAIGAMAKSVAATSQVEQDVLTGHWSRIKADATKLTGDLAGIWDEYGRTVAKRWKETGDLLTWSPKGASAAAPGAASEPGEGGGEGAGTGGAGKKTGSAAKTSPAADALAQMAAHEAAAALEIQRATAQRAVDDYAAAMRQMETDTQTLADLQQREDAARVTINRATVQAQVADYAKLMAEYERQADERAKKELQQAERIKQAWRSAYSSMTETFSNNMTQWITGQESLSRSWSRTLLGMTQTVITNLLQQTVAYIVHAATVDAVRERQKLKDAAEAARKTYIAVAQIPYVGPFLAPVAAAGAFAAVEAFEAGGIVSGSGRMGVPILAHAGERVLSASQTQNFEKMVNQSTSSSSTLSPTFNYSPQISGIDGASVEGMARRHGSTFTREAMRQLRLANKI